MAEEKIKYNVEIDREQLAQELEAVRNQIDLSMGAIADQAVSSPQASNLISGGGEGIAPLPEAPVSDPSGFSNMMEQGFWSNFGANLSGGAQNMMTGLDEASNTISLGAQKFKGDMRRMGLLSQPDYPQFGPRYAGMQDSHREGFFGGVFGALAPGPSGYDPNTLGLNISAYREGSAQSAGESVADFVANWGMAGVGAAIGGFSGFTIGSTLDLAGNIFAADALENRSLAKGIDSIARQNFGGLSKVESQSMARVIQNKAYDPVSRGLDYDIDTIQEDVSSFAQAGGFSSTTNGEEMEQVLEKVVEQTRHFANTLKLKKDEATQIMAQLSSSMTMEGDSDFIDMASKLSYGSSITGMHPGSLASFGLQASEMFRGSGISTSQSFDMAMDARIQAERLRQQDPVTRQLVMDAGGADQFALKQLDSANSYMTSGQGLLTSAGMLGGMEGLTSINDMSSHAAKFLGADPENIFKLTASQGELSGEMSLADKQGVMVSNAVNFAKTMGYADEDGVVDQRTLEGLMPRILEGTVNSPQEARALIEAARDNASRDPAASKMGALLGEREAIIRANQTTFWGGIKTGFYESLDPIEDAFQPTTSAVGEIYTEGMDSIVEGFEDGSDFLNNFDRIRTDEMLTSRGAARGVDEVLKKGDGEISKRIASLSEKYKNTPSSQDAIDRERRSIKERLKKEYEDSGAEVDPSLEALNDYRTSLAVGLTGSRKDNFIEDIVFKGKDFLDSASTLASSGDVVDSEYNALEEGVNYREDLKNLDPNARAAGLLDKAREVYGIGDNESLSASQLGSVRKYMNQVGESHFGDTASVAGDVRIARKNRDERISSLSEKYQSIISSGDILERERESIKERLDEKYKYIPDSNERKALNDRRTSLVVGLSGSRKDNFIDDIAFMGEDVLDDISALADNSEEATDEEYNKLKKSIIYSKDLENIGPNYRAGVVLDRAREVYDISDNESLSASQLGSVKRYMSESGESKFGNTASLAGDVRIARKNRDSRLEGLGTQEAIEEKISQGEFSLEAIIQDKYDSNTLKVLEESDFKEVHQAILSNDLSGLDDNDEKILYERVMGSQEGKDVIKQINEANTDLSLIKINKGAKELAQSMGYEDWEELDESQKNYFNKRVAGGAVSGEDITVADSIGMDQDQMRKILKERGLAKNQIDKAVEAVRAGDKTTFQQTLRKNIGDVRARETLDEFKRGADLGAGGMFQEKGTTASEVAEVLTALTNTDTGPAFKTVSASVVEYYEDKYG